MSIAAEHPVQFTTSHESDSRLLYADKLTDSNLKAFLFTKELSALIIRDAVAPCVASRIVDSIGASRKLMDYVVEPSFQKTGAAWFDHSSDEARAFHLNHTVQYSEDTEELCKPYAPPTDTLKLHLDNMWSPGVFSQRIGGRPLYYGLPRALKPGGAVSPHFDFIGFDSPGAAGIEEIQRQIAINFYLQTAEGGGEIALWDHLDLTPEELRNLRLPGHPYALDEAKLGTPAVTVRPPERSLVFFDATKPHAVRKTTGERPRVTFSAFMGYAGPDKPLTLWS